MNPVSIFSLNRFSNKPKLKKLKPKPTIYHHRIILSDKDKNKRLSHSQESINKNDKISATSLSNISQASLN
jgi:hypothetical protein